ncbi:MAG: ankyrin repeat domain-containing protein [Rickettsiaceae bacterium]|nr:ankyrin repeat domain-containing protein [Rickettsiaceae bacterium]
MDVYDLNQRLLLATSSQNLEYCRYLIQEGADKNYPEPITRRTPLQYAVEVNSFEIANMLIKEGVNIEQKDCIGDTALHLSCRIGNTDIVNLLLYSGANINSSNVNGRTPIFEACSEGHQEIVNILIKHNVDINAQDEDNKRPLHIVCIKKDTDLAKTLILNGAYINVCDDTKTTPLHITCARNLTETAFMLIDYDANVNIMSVSLGLPLHLATLKGNLALVRKLLENGSINTNHNNPHMPTPLKLALSLNNSLIVQAYIEYGVKIQNDLIGSNLTNLYLYHTNNKLKNACEKLANKQALSKNDVNMLLNYIDREDIEEIYTQDLKELFKVMINPCHLNPKIIFYTRFKDTNLKTNNAKITDYLIEDSTISNLEQVHTTLPYNLISYILSFLYIVIPKHFVSDEELDMINMNIFFTRKIIGTHNTEDICEDNIDNSNF